MVAPRALVPLLVPLLVLVLVLVLNASDAPQDRDTEGRAPQEQLYVLPDPEPETTDDRSVAPRFQIRSILD